MRDKRVSASDATDQDYASYDQSNNILNMSSIKGKSEEIITQ